MQLASPVSPASPAPSRQDGPRQQSLWARDVLNYRDDPQNHGHWPPRAHAAVFRLRQAARNGTLAVGVRNLLRTHGYTDLPG